jgi:hypothetical protein
MMIERQIKDKKGVRLEQKAEIVRRIENCEPHVGVSSVLTLSGTNAKCL